ncbi:MAG TPA: sugar kinase [Xanthomonadales bacterium]|nr:sugar kinase [Xanthomonadales bacterium]
MTPVLAPRVMVVTRPSDLELLVEEHGTREQARFLTHDRRGWFDEAVRRDELQKLAVADVLKNIPIDWRRGRLDRSDLATFSFAPEDVVVAVGQDGLVANVAKYLDRQLVIGVNPDPDNVEGTLVRFTRTEFSRVITLVEQNRAPADELTLIEAHLDDGQVLHALNEIFIGHRSHQSARYRLRIGDREERQSSSGIIVATGTGATGWARSISRERNLQLDVDARSHRLAVLVREAFPAPGFGTQLTTAFVDDRGVVSVTSEMGDGGVIFGDGIEADFLRFGWGRHVELRPSNVPLRLARPPAP